MVLAVLQISICVLSNLLITSIKNIYLQYIEHRNMQKITITELAKTIFNLPKETTLNSLFPTIPPTYNQQHNQHHTQHTHPIKPSKSLVGFNSLRKLLNDDNLAQLSKMREQSEHNNYMRVKQQLLRDISNDKQFLNSKAESLARKILLNNAKEGKMTLGIQINKGKNYLNKIVKDYQNRRDEEAKIQKGIKQKMKENEG